MLIYVQYPIRIGGYAGMSELFPERIAVQSQGPNVSSPILGIRMQLAKLGNKLRK